jgi:hypothetical protein
MPPRLPVAVLEQVSMKLPFADACSWPSRANEGFRFVA